MSSGDLNFFSGFCNKFSPRFFVFGTVDGRNLREAKKLDTVDLEIAEDRGSGRSLRWQAGVGCEILGEEETNVSAQVCAFWTYT